MSIKRVFKEIESLTEYKILYNNNQVNTKRVVSVDYVQTPVSEILADVFKGTTIKYELLSKQIVLTQGQPRGNIDDGEGDGQDEAQNQDRSVTGTVLDENGDPLPGVLIYVEGTTTGATTDFDGKYTISVNSDTDVLVFSYIGMKTVSKVVGSQNTIDLQMEVDAKALEEVVVIGYGSVKRSDVTGSVASVSVSDVKTQPAARIDEALQGRTSGLVIQNNSAAPDGTFTIRIRGSNSLTGSNDPLVVIDGFIGGNLSTVNPNDIQSIEVLKDASSTAIYGSRGANGVILVTTKAGATGKTVVQYNSYTNFQSINKKIDLLNAAEYAETVNANRSVLGLPLPFSEDQISSFRTNGGTDWQDVVFRNAIQQNHQVSISGGGEKGKYYLSGNLTDNEGIIVGSSFKRYSVRSNVESAIGSKFKVGVNMFMSRTENHPAVTGGNQDSSPVQAALIWAPTQPIYNEDGGYTRPSSSYGPPAVNNPLGIAVEPIRDNLGSRIELNSFLNMDIVKGLTARVLFGARFVDNENSTYLNTKPNGGLGLEEATIYNSRMAVYQLTNQLNYSTTFGEDHNLDITAVYEQQRENFNSSQAGSSGFLTDLLTYNNLGLGAAPQVPTSERTQKDIQSVVGRINYSYADKYLLTLNGRYDGASVFSNDKWGFFPSAALAWRVNNEDFMSKVTAINNLKFRTSYGITGSQAIEPYSSLSQLNSNLPYPIDGTNLTPGVGLGIYGNPDLKWEKTAQFNVGVDVGLYNNRLTFTGDYYNKKTSDLLLNVPLPRISGYQNVLRNVGKVENQGFELNLGGVPFDGEFKWKTDINFSRNRNKVLELSGTDEIVAGSTGFPNMGNTIFLIVGQPIGMLKGYIQDGIWGTDEADLAASFGSIPGAPRYVDQNNDGQINSDDIAVMGSTQPKFTYGWNNSFQYKNFDLNILLQGTEGNKVYNLTRVRSERTSSDADATDRRILSRWTPDNQNTNVPSFEGSNQYEKLQSSRWLEDGSYLRVKNVTLGYDLTDALKNTFISYARIYVGGVNLFTFTDYTGYDPEASTNVGTLGGIDMAPYPSQRTFTVGLNLTF
ncbi:TonB-dependent receptor [Flagellimonas pelagia]|uniref:TonB-dependent receptor n=1 Tax=Flagellimonas pelagia TaxID=2306998 RepID=UPI001604FC49|nr:TonB-dependent receptor [Allomuricauda maritima]